MDRIRVREDEMRIDLPNWQDQLKYRSLVAKIDKKQKYLDYLETMRAGTQAQIDAMENEIRLLVFPWENGQERP